MGLARKLWQRGLDALPVSGYHFIVLSCCCKATTGDEWVCVTRPGWSSCVVLE